MRTIVRHITGEFLRVFVMSLLGITIFSLLIVVGAQAVREGLGLGPILRMMPFILPVTMRYSIPAAALLAGCMVFGRMSSDNEIVAMKSMGISPAAVILPVLIVAFLISVGTVWVNDVAVSWGRPGAQRVISESIEQIAYSMLSMRRSYEMDGFSIVVKRVEGKRLILPIIKIREDEEGDELIVAADEARLEQNPEADSLTIYLTNATIDGANGISGIIPGEHERVVELPSAKSNKRHLRSPSDFAIRDLGEERAYQARHVSHLEGTMAVDAAFGIMAGDMPNASDGKWEQRTTSLAKSKYRINRLRTEPWRRWANGFSCFFFLMVGVPLSIRMRNADFVASFFSTFLPILMVYYPLMTYGVDRAKDGTWPQYACWLGNAACCAWAAWLMKRVLRY